MNDQAKALTIVTACDERYWRCADQFLRSAKRHQLDRGPHRFVCYDLGLSPRHRQTLATRWPWCEIRPFVFERYPAHVAVAHGNYAWKPLLIAEAAKACGPLLWLDSATLFKTSDLTAVCSRLAAHGTYTLRGWKNLLQGCDRRVLLRMRCAPELWLRSIHVSGVVGLDPAYPGVGNLLTEWCQAALDPECNLRPGPAHSADQALLSVALHHAEARGELRLNDEEIDISSRNPVRWMSSRNKVKGWWPAAADPLARAYYELYKRLDRVGLRARHLYRTQGMGLHRATREHYTVFLASVSSPARREVQAPRACYYADPFVWMNREQAWLFVEEFRYPQCRGRIVARSIGRQLELGPAEVVLDLPQHCSFPFLFARNGQLYLVPETSTQRTIDLYECVEMPSSFLLKRRLMVDVDAADSVLFEHQQLFWILTSVRATPTSERHLALFFSRDLDSNEWTPHPVNHERRYADKPFGYGRNAGPITFRGERWRRMMHSSLRHYGEAVTPMVIEELTPERFVERPDPSPDPAFSVASVPSPHHLGRCGELVFWDVRDRVS